MRWWARDRIHSLSDPGEREARRHALELNLIGLPGFLNALHGGGINLQEEIISSEKITKMILSFLQSPHQLRTRHSESRHHPELLSQDQPPQPGNLHSESPPPNLHAPEGRPVPTSGFNILHNSRPFIITKTNMSSFFFQAIIFILMSQSLVRKHKIVWFWRWSARMGRWYKLWIMSGWFPYTSRVNIRAKRRCTSFAEAVEVHSMPSCWRWDIKHKTLSSDNKSMNIYFKYINK